LSFASGLLSESGSAVGDLLATRDQDLEPEVGSCFNGSNQSGGRIQLLSS